ncbi:hypothetical protein B0A48_04881 [Cryoendolithus antarcticus]|uniref:HTH La-type RNA-binding domain-containing protein n=1 Tax=Cryoendolithus antarcticus TaxID=1507870 RepID=A0A1V8TDZ6_9PEZI|nr:hypothetical protein B0A48_04881 [Cryoendolithus antarcticus]
MADPLSSPSAQADATTKPPISNTTTQTTTVSNTAQPPATNTVTRPTLDKAAVIRQVEYYFSDANLATDTHLLGKLQEAKYGPGCVSLKQILSWGRMRDFKPSGDVKNALRESTIVEVVDNKYIRRKIPYDMAKAKVEPAIRAQELVDSKKNVVLAANPHLSKGMLRPTNFEHDYVNPALTPEERRANEDDYSTDNSFCYRMELAIVRYLKKRRGHEKVNLLFDDYLDYCGIHKDFSQFTGGISKTEIEGLSKDEIETRNTKHFVLDEARESIDAGDGTWFVNFPGTLRGFFSTRFSTRFDTTHQEVVEASCNILRNWFKYLLHHNVFAEYTDQLEESITILDEIEREFPLMAKASKSLPGVFNIAASIAMNGSATASCVKQESYEDDDFKPDISADAMVFTKQDARTIFLTGIVAYGTQSQIDRAEAHVTDLTNLRVVWEDDDVHLEITEISLLSDADATTQDLFQGLGHTIVPALGKMTCKRYEKPNFSDREPAPDWDGHETFEFIVDEKTLYNCYVGLKFDAVVKELEMGILWIDHLYYCDGSFYKWCWNEIVMDQKKAKKDPRGWGRWDDERKKDDDGTDKAAAYSDGDGDSDFEDY